VTKMVTLPLWVVLLAGIFTAWAVLSLLLRGVRAFFLKREARFLRMLRARYKIDFPAFKLVKKRAVVARLLTDPQVLSAVEKCCRELGTSLDAGLKKAALYADEIVPSFHAYAYYILGSLVAASLARLLYRIRVHYVDEERLADISQPASLVFIINHRSNMDYILLGTLTLRRAPLSFAVGEWARVWPVEPLVKSMGAYFVRRGSGDPLYRRILARYVQISVEGGLIQAVFPEGRLSRDGGLSEPKVGLLE
jgi:glycerol-3-phosphate O-acyltransferase